MEEKNLHPLGRKEGWNGLNYTALEAEVVAWLEG